MPRIFVDTGAWYALLDKTDSCHAHAVEFFQSLARPLVTTWKGSTYRVHAGCGKSAYPV